MIQRKTKRDIEMKNHGADIYEDYGYSKKWDGEWCWRGLTDIIDVCSESLSFFVAVYRRQIYYTEFVQSIFSKMQT